MNAWINTSDLAKIARCSRQAAHKVARAFLEGRTDDWRGAILRVRPANGQGGRSGKFLQIKFDSLPVELKNLSNTPETPLQYSLKLDAPADHERAWKQAVLGPALRTEAGTPERRAAVRAIVSAEHIRGTQRVRLPERTVQRWLAGFAKHGMAGLTRKKRRDAGTQTVLITKTWDAATEHLSDQVRQGIKKLFERQLRSLWGQGVSYIDVKRLASEYLADATADAGTALTEAELVAACELPKNVVEKHRSARAVHEYRTNRKAWDDKRARVALTSAGLLPMQIVYGDVHHFDIYLEREDGSKATPKGIAWLDAATRRVRMDIVLCEPGTAIRNSDLIESFVAMTQDPYWGMPSRLYLDNGSEYGFADLAECGLRLAGLQCTTFGEASRSNITRAQAYNAAAKGILEGSFRIFEQTILSTLPGYIGGNRMQSRSANLGKAPKAWPGPFDLFKAQHEGLMRYWMTRPQSGDLKGLSPEQALTRAIEAGWARSDVDPYALLFAFSTEDTRTVKKGKIEFGGEKLYCDGLAAFTGQKVRVRLPRYLKWHGVPVYPLNGGELIGIAKPDVAYHRNDPAGAVEAARRKKVAVDAVKAQAATIEPIDAPARMVASGKRQTLPLVPKSGGLIGLSVDDEAAGRRLAEPAETQARMESLAKQAKHRERLALLARHGKLERKP